MDASPTRLLIISRDLLLDIEEETGSDLVFRQLAIINRRGTYLLVTAAEPDHWVPTRGNVDNALQQQRRIQRKLQVAGGDMDGMYYVPRSLLTQDRNRKGALKDILRRYALEPDEAVLLSASKPFIKAALGLGVPVFDASTSTEGVNRFLNAIKTP